MVGQRTMGRSLSTGRGATAAALARRALRRRDLRPGCLERRSSSAPEHYMYLADFSGSEGGGDRRKWGFEVPLGVRVTRQEGYT